MPDACFQCHQRGHVARNCPSRKTRRGQQEQKDEAKVEMESKKPVAPNNTGAETPFTPAPGMKEKTNSKEPVQLQFTNAFAALADLEDEDEEEHNAPVAPANPTVDTEAPEADQADAEENLNKTTDMEVEMAKRKREREKGTPTSSSLDSPPTLRSLSTAGLIGQNNLKLPMMISTANQSGSNARISRSTRSKGQKGSGIRGKALRLRQILKIFVREGEDWMRALQALIQHAVTKRPGGQISRLWTTQELLLAHCPRRIPKAQTATGLLTAWTEAVGHRSIEQEDILNDGYSHVNLHINLLVKQGRLTRQQEILIRRTLRSAGIHDVGWWADWACTQNSVRPLREMDEVAVEIGMAIEVQSGAIESLPWFWKIGSKTYSTWLLPTALCKNLFQKHDSLNKKFAKSKWEGLRYLTEGPIGCPPPARTFLEAFDKAFSRNTPALYMGFVAGMKAIWHECNMKCYSGKICRIPYSISLQLVLTMAQAQLGSAQMKTRNETNTISTSASFRLTRSRKEQQHSD
ncbi:hypothetical protein R1sor_013011 [Riccia sorocarpa]|uniref:CCHC-type domain-containing protein n=1 Tax=Riccia sorocarpa TaxID=122646 RepID=A0ABD3H5A7_9MARC